MRATKKFIALLLVLAMTLGMFAGLSLTAGAAEAVGTYTLVKDVADLHAGDTVIIVASGYEKALSTTQNPNNRGTAVISKSGDDITLAANSGVEALVLGTGTTTGTFSFGTYGDDPNTITGYLYAASSSSNYLRTETDLSANSSWSIDITSEGVATVTAQGTNTRNLLKYNNSSTIFSCYESGQMDIAIYKLSGGGGTAATTAHVLWCDYDGTTIKDTYHPEGTIPEYDSEDNVPTRADDTVNHKYYTFAGWSDTLGGSVVNLEEVAGSQEYHYYAVYTEHTMATVNWISHEGTDTQYINPTNFTAPTPEAYTDNNTRYVFTSWTNLAVTQIVDGQEYTFTAQYTASVSKQYTMITAENAPEDWSGEYLIAGRVSSAADKINTFALLDASGETKIVDGKENAINIADADATLTVDGAALTGAAGEVGNVIETEDANLIWIIEQIDPEHGYYTIREKNHDVYISSNGTYGSGGGGNSMNFSLETSTAAQWMITQVTVNHPKTFGNLTSAYTADMVSIRNVQYPWICMLLNTVKNDDTSRMFRGYYIPYYNRANVTGYDKDTNTYTSESDTFNSSTNAGSGSHEAEIGIVSGSSTYNLVLFGNQNPFRAQIIYQGEQKTIVNPVSVQYGRETAVDLTGVLTPDMAEYPNFSLVSGPSWSISSKNNASNPMTIDANGDLLLNEAATGDYALVTLSYTVHDSVNNADDIISTQAKVEVVAPVASYATVIYYEDASANKIEQSYTVSVNDDSLMLDTFLVDRATDAASTDPSCGFTVSGTATWTATNRAGQSVPINNGELDLTGVTTEDLITVRVNGLSGTPTGGNPTAATEGVYYVYVSSDVLAQITHTVDGSAVTGNFLVPFASASIPLSYKTVCESDGLDASDKGYTITGTPVWSIVSGEGATINASTGTVDASACAAGTVIRVQLTGLSSSYGTSAPKAIEPATVLITVNEDSTLELNKDTFVIDFAKPVTLHPLTNDAFPQDSNYAIAAVYMENGTTPATDVTFTSDSITYTPPVNETLHGKVTYKYTVNVNGVPKADRGTIVIIPASNLYYEATSDLFEFSTGWVQETMNDKGEFVPGGSSNVPNQEENRTGDNVVYGYDANYNVSSPTVSDGYLFKTTVSATDNNKTATFEFYGTGFDINSLCSNDTGVVTVRYYAFNSATNSYADKPTRSLFVDTYVGYKYEKTPSPKTDAQGNPVYKYYIPEEGDTASKDFNFVETDETYTDGNGETQNLWAYQFVGVGQGNYARVQEMTYWSKDSTTGSAFYNVPVMSVNALPYNRYKVVIQPTYYKPFDKNNSDGENSYDFYLDSIRIYNPCGTTATLDSEIADAYAQDGEYGAGYKSINGLLTGKEAYSITYHTPAGVTAPETQTGLLEGSGAILAGAPAELPNGDWRYSFVGWVSEAVDNQTTSGTVLQPLSTVAMTGNLDYYALYSYKQFGSFTKSDAAPAHGENGILAAYVDGSYYALANDLTAVPVLVLNDTIVSSPKLRNWSAVDGSYNGSTGIVLSCDAGKLHLNTTGLTLKTNDQNGTLVFTVNANGFTAFSNQNSRYLSFNGTSFGTTADAAGAATVCFFKQTVPADTYYTTIISECADHSLVAVPVIAPTCTEEGREAFWFCTLCGRSFSDAAATTLITAPAAIAPNGHIDGDGDHICDVCGEAVTPPACAHADLDEIVAVAATCSDAGNIAYWYCNDCDKAFSTADCATEITLESTEIAALGHDYQYNVVAPTCTEQGYTEVTCSRGDYNDMTDITEALGHSYGEWTYNNDELTHTHTCTVCSDTETANCTWNAGEVTTPATATTPGVMTYTCSVCSGTKTAEIPVAVVDYTVAFTVPAGVTAVADMTCASTGSIILPTPTGAPTANAQNYVFAGWVTATVDNSATLPTILAAGSEYTATADTTLIALYTYAVGGGSASDFSLVTDANELADGNYVLIVRANATDTYKGNYTYYALQRASDGTGYVAAAAADPYMNDSVPATISVTDATLIWAGTGSSSGFTLTGSDGNLNNSSNSLNYNTSAASSWTVAEQESTDTFTVVNGDRYLGLRTDIALSTITGNPRFRCNSSAGNASYYFNIYKQGAVGTTYYTTVLLSHTHAVESVAAVAATCTAAGNVAYYYCSAANCPLAGRNFADDALTNELTVTVIAALGHDMVAGTVVAATCTEEGYTPYACSRCDETEMRNITAALGHDFSVMPETTDETNYMAPTCTVAGLAYKKCSRCDVFDTEGTIVAATGHTPAATYSHDATNHWHVCTVCGLSCGDETTHTWNEGEQTTAPTATETGVMTYTCTVCPETRTETIPALGVNYTVSFTVPDGVTAINDMSCASGDSVTLPTPTGTPTANAHQYVFAGWVTAAVDNSTTEPTVYAAGSDYTPSANATLIALYTYSESTGGSGSGDYVKVTTAPTDWAGDYLIVYEAENMILDGSLTTLDAANNYQSVTITNETILAAAADAYKVTIAASGTSWTIQTASGYYIGATSNANTMNSNTSTAYTNSLALDGDGNATVISSGGAYLRFNTSSGQDRFRYYKSGSYSSQQPIALYAKSSGGGGSTTTYFTTVLETVTACTHTNLTATAAVAATCTTAGNSAYWQCADCNKYFSDSAATTVITLASTEIAALGHNYGAWSYNNNNLSHTRTCTRCNVETETENCTWGTGSVTTPATATTPGVITYTCSVCSGTKTGVIPAIGTGPATPQEVDYLIQNGRVANWGSRGATATFLTTYAVDYYTGSYTYATLAANSGATASSSTASDIYNSDLGSALHSMVAAKQTTTTSYDGTKDMYCFTDCLQNDIAHISSYYSGTQLNAAWDSGATWNREHTWPNSKGLGSSDENDIMMLRPTSTNENGARGNLAYGSGSGYYDPNEISNNALNLHGDVARLMLQHFIRWGNTQYLWGTSGVFESRAVMLQWLEEDPVDTWEMGRNDAVQSITGVRNVFVDYPELAFQLLGADVPTGYTTPSTGGGSVTPTTYDVVIDTMTNGTVTASAAEAAAGTTINLTVTPATGYMLSSLTVYDNDLTEITVNNNSFTMPASDVLVEATFVAESVTPTTYTIDVSEQTNGTVTATPNPAAAGTTVTLTATPDAGYTFSEWMVLDGNGDEVTVNGNTFVMPASEVLVGASFVTAPVTGYTVTLNDNGTTSTLSGTTVTLPSGTATGYTFEGWVTSATPATDTQPTTIPVGSYTPTADITLYALYSYTQSSGGSTSYTMVAASDVTEGVYLIGALRSASATNNFYFATKTVSSGDLNTNAAATTIAEVAGVRSITDLPANAVEFTFAGDNTNGFTISPSNDGTYLGYTSYASRKLAFNASYSTTKWKAQAKSGSLLTNGVTLVTSSGSAYTISENSTAVGAIRGYANTTTYRAIYLFKKGTSGGTSTTYYSTTVGGETPSSVVPQQARAATPHGAISGMTENAVFIDGNGAASVTEYQSYGPNNEVYLTSMQAVAFTLNTAEVDPESVQIGMKTVDGSTNTIDVTIQICIDRDTVVDTITKTVQSTAAMYYDITGDYDWANNNYIIYVGNNNPENGGLLSLTNIKWTMSRDVQTPRQLRAVVTPETTSRALKTMNELIANETPTDPEEPGVDISGLSFKSASLNLANGISTNFIAKAELLDAFDSVWAVVTGADGNAVRIDAEQRNTDLYFTYTGSTALDMGAEFTATIYGEKNGVTYTGTSKTYSIKQYAMNMLGKETSSAELKTLCADLLNYGAAAQTFKGVNLSALANADMTVEMRAYASDPAATVLNDFTAKQTINSELGRIASASLNLVSNIELNYYLQLPAVDGAALTLTYTSGSGEEKTAVIDASDLVANGSYYVATFRGLQSVDLRCVITATLTVNGETAETTTYSVESYAARKAAGSDENLSALVKAIMAYGDAASVFFGFMEKAEKNIAE